MRELFSLLQLSIFVAFMLPIAIAEDFDDIELYQYDFRYAKMQSGILYLGLKYRGGCVAQHHFELTKDKGLTEDGILQLFLFDRTLNDECLAIVHTKREFDLHYVLEKEKPKAIQINDPGILVPI